jgi:outer membrane protein OmpA-like peptidoglycan-associated protein
MSKSILHAFTIVFVAVAGGHIAAEDHYPGSAYPRVFWRSESAGATINPPNLERSPIELFDLPHRIGDETRPVFGAAGGITGDGIGSGAAAAAVIPNLYASVGAALGYLNDDDGVLIRGDLAAARPIGTRTVAGASITGQFARGDEDDVGVGLSVGASHRIGSLGGLSRLRVHGGMRNVGKTVRRVDDEVPVFPAFSPFVGFDALPIVSNDLSIGISSTVTIDRFQGISFDAVGVVRFADGITASVGWWQRIGSGDSGIWPGVTAGIRIPLGGDEARYRGHVGVQPLRGGSAAITGGVVTAFESIDTVPPEVEVTTEDGNNGLIVLSPHGERRQGVFELSATDDRHIARIEAVLVDSQGRTLRSWDFVPRYAAIVSDDIADRLSSPLHPTSATGTAVFDLQDAEGDGFYRIDIEAIDAAENRSSRVSREILVDTEPPEVLERSLETVSETDVDAAIQDPITIRESEAVAFSFVVRGADAIEAVVIDAAERTIARPELTLSDDLDENGFYTGMVTWSGVRDDGARAEEGIYRVEVTAFDEIGNLRSVRSDRIVVERTTPAFQIDLSDTTVVATDTEGRGDIVVRPKIEPIVGLKEWRIDIRSVDSDVPIRTWSGIDLPPESIVLDTSLFPNDGTYTIIGSSRYENGSDARTLTRSITVDRVAPSVEIAVSPQRVQPENGREVTVYVESDGTATEGRLVARRKSVGESTSVEVGTFDRVPDRTTWSFVDGKGELVEPGIYELSLEVADAYGNTSMSDAVDVLLLERLSGVGIVAADRTISPNGDGISDMLRFSVDGPSREGGTFALEIVDADGNEVRTIRGETEFPRTIVWDGRRGDGGIVADGLYRGRISVDFPELDPLIAETPRFRVDTEAPNGSVSIQGERIVSPDGDGRKDELTIVLGGFEDDPSGGRVVDVHLRSPEDAELRIDVAHPANPPQRFSWLPRRDDGTSVPDGEYVIAVTISDTVGNDRTVTSEPFQIDTRPVRAYLRIDRGAINPIVEDPRRSVEFQPVVSDPSRVERWSFEIVQNGTDRVVLQDTGEGDSLPESIEWPRRSDSRNDSVEDGEYVAELQVQYRHGPIFTRRSPAVTVDSTAPIVAVDTEPLPFSPDGDGTADVLQFDIDVTDASPISYWYLEIIDPKGEFFYDVGGEGDPPAKLAWDGTARNGETVISAETYSWRVELSDRLGNVKEVEGSIPIDILVEPYNGGYRMQVPSITFPPNSSALVLEGPEPGAVKNREVLDRVSEILKRYPTYNVVVEGHAVNVTGTEREEREELIPLSTARAEAVRDALIGLGVPRGMISAEGRGGTVPVVEHTDTTMRWKNRRVDFVLQRVR